MVLSDETNAPATVPPALWRSISSVCSTRGLVNEHVATVVNTASLLRRRYAHCFRFALEHLTGAVTAAASRCLAEDDWQPWARIVEEAAGTLQHAALHNPGRRKVRNLL